MILAISGSLRSRSSTTEALRAAALLAAPRIEVKIFEGLAGLPAFNPDLDEEGPKAPALVRDFRARIGAADAVLICSPEYAHGVPGSLKNALDWLVSAPEMLFKPVGLLNISPRATYAYAALAETLQTMSTTLIDGASITLPLFGERLDATAIAGRPEFAEPLKAAVQALENAAAAYRLRQDELQRR